MTDSQQKFNKAGVPTFAFFFLIAMGATLFYMTRALTPRNSVSGRLNYVVKGLQGACLFQVLTGLFMVFSAAQNTGITLMIVPMLGIFALHTLDPNMLVLYSALQFFLLTIIQELPDAFQAAGACRTKFGDHDYCKSRWRSFLTFLAVLYHFISLVHALAHFYFFMTFHTGALEHSPNAGIYSPLVSGESPPQPTHAAQGYQGASYQSPPAFQQQPPSAPPQHQHQQPQQKQQAPPSAEEKAPF